MKQKLNIREKLALRLGSTLEYTAAGIAVAGVVVGILFTFNFLGNKKNAVANIKGTNTIILLPEGDDGGNNKREAQPVVTITNSSDSLYIEFSSENDEPIQSAVLNLKEIDGKVGTEAMAQARVMTFYSPNDVNKKTYHFAIPANQLPENMNIEAKANLASHEATPVANETSWSTSFDYNRQNSSVKLLPGQQRLAVKVSN
jgi:hypothetical protein